MDPHLNECEYRCREDPSLLWLPTNCTVSYKNRQLIQENKYYYPQNYYITDLWPPFYMKYKRCKRGSVTYIKYSINIAKTVMSPLMDYLQLSSKKSVTSYQLFGLAIRRTGSE